MNHEEPSETKPQPKYQNNHGKMIDGKIIS